MEAKRGIPPENETMKHRKNEELIIIRTINKKTI